MILQVEFDLDNGVKMAVNFDKMVQKNKKTGWERPIRIAVKDEKDKSKIFCWVILNQGSNLALDNLLVFIPQSIRPWDIAISLQSIHRSQV